jgi:hypothetical protein
MIISQIKKNSFIKKIYARIKQSLNSVGGETINQKQFNNILKRIDGGINEKEIKNVGKLFIDRKTNEIVFHERYFDLLIKYAAQVRGYYQLPAEYVSKLFKDSRELEHNIMASEKWLEYCHFCMLNGMFQLGAIIRSKAIESSYIEVNSSNAGSNQLFRAFKAAVDQADYPLAEVILDRLSNAVEDNDVVMKYRLFLSMCSGDLEKVRFMTKELFSIAEELFFEYLNGKNVALVGPAPISDGAGKEIDAHDIVVRISYTGENSTVDQENFGSKVNISYYGNVFSEAINKTSNSNFLDKLDYAVFKTICHRYRKELVQINKGRVFFSPNYCFFNGSAHMVQNALFDLLHFSPKKIKLFNINFFLAEKPHYTGYSDIIQGNKDYEWHKFQRHANHKYLSSLNFTRNLWKSGVIEVDNFCKDILSMTSEGYMLEMQRIYIRQD